MTQPSEVDFDSFKKGIHLVPHEGQRFSRKQRKNPALPNCYEDFVSDYPYRKITESQERVSKTKSLRSAKKSSTFDKIGNYLKQSKEKEKRQNEKVLRLRLKNMADKTMPNNTRFSGQANDNSKYYLKKGLFDEENDEKSTY